MNGSDNLMKPREVLALKLDELRRRHRTLDDAILMLEERDHVRDNLDLRRLKKEKLALKDEIARIEDRMTPDIIA